MAIWTEMAFYAYATEKSRLVALASANADCAERQRKRPDRPCRVLPRERPHYVRGKPVVGYAVEVRPA